MQCAFANLNLLFYFALHGRSDLCPPTVASDSDTIGLRVGWGAPSEFENKVPRHERSRSRFGFAVEDEDLDHNQNSSNNDDTQRSIKHKGKDTVAFDTMECLQPTNGLSVNTPHQHTTSSTHYLQTMSPRTGNVAPGLLATPDPANLGT